MARHRGLFGVSFVLALTNCLILQADTITESFSYVDQADASAPYLITTDGVVGGPTVLQFGEGLATQVSIISNVVHLDTAAGSGLSDEFVGIADIPGFVSPFGGPFGSYFSSPQNLTGAFGSIDAAQSAGSNATRFRMLAIDSGGNEIATSDFSLGSSLTTYNFNSSDFTILLDGATTFDESQTTGLGIEFFATLSSGNVDALQFQVDNFTLTVVPEPGSFAVLLSAGICLLMRRRKPGRPVGQIS
jgi:hypothetical protein